MAGLGVGFISGIQTIGLNHRKTWRRKFPALVTVKNDTFLSSIGTAGHGAGRADEGLAVDVLLRPGRDIVGTPTDELAQEHNGGLQTISCRRDLLSRGRGVRSTTKPGDEAPV